MHCPLLQNRAAATAHQAAGGLQRCRTRAAAAQALRSSANALPSPAKQCRSHDAPGSRGSSTLPYTCRTACSSRTPQGFSASTVPVAILNPTSTYSCVRAQQGCGWKVLLPRAVRCWWHTTCQASRCHKSVRPIVAVAASSKGCKSVRPKRKRSEQQLWPRSTGRSQAVCNTTHTHTIKETHDTCVFYLIVTRPHLHVVDHLPSPACAGLRHAWLDSPLLCNRNT